MITEELKPVEASQEERVKMTKLFRMAIIMAEAIVEKYPGFQLAAACDTDSDYDSGLESDYDEDIFWFSIVSSED